MNGATSRLTTTAPVSQVGLPPRWRASTTRPQSSPVTAPCAPAREASRNSSAPSAPQAGRTASACAIPRASEGRCRPARSPAAGPSGDASRHRRGRPRRAPRRPRPWRPGRRPRAGRGRARCGWPPGGRGTGRASAASSMRVPCWTTRPRSRTATSGARSIVESRWATRMPVRAASSRSAAATTRRSVSGSMRAVASSSTTTRTSRTSRRANATSCSSPADSDVPPGPRRVSRPSGSPATQPSRPSSTTAASTVLRGRSAKSVMFSARVPARISVRWVTTPTARRRRWRSRSRTSTPPRNTVSRGGSIARETRAASVDLPEPVRPTRATVWPAGTRRSMPCKANVPSV